MLKICHIHTWNNIVPKMKNVDRKRFSFENQVRMRSKVRLLQMEKFGKQQGTLR